MDSSRLLVQHFFGRIPKVAQRELASPTYYCYRLTNLKFQLQIPARHRRLQEVLVQDAPQHQLRQPRLPQDDGGVGQHGERGRQSLVGERDDVVDDVGQQLDDANVHVDDVSHRRV